MHCLERACSFFPSHGIALFHGDPLVKVLGGGGLPTVPPISGTISVRVGGGVEIGTGGHRNRYRGMVTLDRASDPELSNSDNA